VYVEHCKLIFIVRYVLAGQLTITQPTRVSQFYLKLIPKMVIPTYVYGEFHQLYEKESGITLYNFIHNDPDVPPMCKRNSEIIDRS
jgi:hypothetical protein